MDKHLLMSIIFLVGVSVGGIGTHIAFESRVQVHIDDALDSKDYYDTVVDRVDYGKKSNLKGVTK